MSSDKLEMYAFVWLLLLLLFSAAAMFLGAQPLVLKVAGSSSSGVYSLLNLAWIVSGVAAVYLTYLWVKGGKQVFGGNDQKSKFAFFFMLVAGYNMGLTGVLGNNIFLSFASGMALYVIAGALCLISAYLLWTGWKANGQSLFASSGASSSASSSEPETQAQSSQSSDEEAKSDDSEGSSGM